MPRRHKGTDILKFPNSHILTSSHPQYRTRNHELRRKSHLKRNWLISKLSNYFMPKHAFLCLFDPKHAQTSPNRESRFLSASMFVLWKRFQIKQASVGFGFQSPGTWLPPGIQPGINAPNPGELRRIPEKRGETRNIPEKPGEFRLNTPNPGTRFLQRYMFVMWKRFQQKKK